MPASNPKIGWPLFDPQVGDEVVRSPGFLLPNEKGVVVERSFRRVKVDLGDRFEDFELTENNAFWRQDNPKVPPLVRAIIVPPGDNIPVKVDKKKKKK